MSAKIFEHPARNSKFARQVKALKENFGFGTLFGLIAVFISLATPIALQSGKNSDVARAIKTIEESQKTMADGFAGLSGQLSGLREDAHRAQESATRSESMLNAARASWEQQFIDLRQRVDTALLQGGKLEAKLAALEARQQKSEK